MILMKRHLGGYRKMARRGIITVISGPSGCGKNSIIKAAAEKNPYLSYVTSATTREMRAGEAEGVNYYYKTKEEFERLICTGEILEWDEFCGNRYGTLKSEISSKIEAGMDLILDLTISGAIAVKREFPVDAVTVFVLPPSIEELQTRLQYRLRETEEQIQERVANALCNEIQQIGNFDYVLVNDILNDTRDHLLAIISAERLKYKRNKGILEELNLKGEKI